MQQEAKNDSMLEQCRLRQIQYTYCICTNVHVVLMFVNFVVSINCELLYTQAIYFFIEILRPIYKCTNFNVSENVWNYKIANIYPHKHLYNYSIIAVECNSGPKVIKLFSCLTQLSMKFSLLINMKMPTIVGIFIFISREIFSYV